VVPDTTSHTTNSRSNSFHNHGSLSKTYKQSYRHLHQNYFLEYHTIIKQLSSSWEIKNKSVGGNLQPGGGMHPPNPS
jgi:hypothetical protein